MKKNCPTCGYEMTLIPTDAGTVWVCGKCSHREEAEDINLCTICLKKDKERVRLRKAPIREVGEGVKLVCPRCGYEESA